MSTVILTWDNNRLRVISAFCHLKQIYTLSKNSLQFLKCCSSSSGQIEICEGCDMAGTSLFMFSEQG